MGAHSLWPVEPVEMPAALLDPARWPRKPYCSDDKTARNIRPFLSALKRSYIQANPPHLRVWSIYDIDRPGAAFAWEDAMLPPPSWVAVNAESQKGHIVYGLSAPVLVDSPDLRQKPLRYLCAIEAAFRFKLGADQGYSGLLTKNPVHGDWRVLRGPTNFYDLDELAGWVDLSKFAPKRKPEEVGLGRNVTLFDRLRVWAYVAIRQYRDRRNHYPHWQAECYGKALDRNGDFRNPMDSRECYHIAKSVARWTWRKDAEAFAKFRARMSIRGKRSGAVRLAASEDKRASARLMRAQGQSIRQIAAALGVSAGSVHAWCSGVQ